MNRAALLAGAVGLVHVLAGCGGAKSREAALLALPTGTDAVRGVDVWADVVREFPDGRVIYQENVQVGDPKRARAVETQKAAAPHAFGMPEPLATWPLTFDGAARNLVKAMVSTQELLGEQLIYADVEKASSRVLMHAREIVKALEIIDRGLGVSADVAAIRPIGTPEPLGEGESGEARSEEETKRALVQRWMPQSKMIEANATRLWRAAATHSPSEIREWSEALVDSCEDLREAFPPARKGRRRPKTEAGQERPAESDEEEEAAEGEEYEQKEAGEETGAAPETEAEAEPETDAEKGGAPAEVETAEPRGTEGAEETEAPQGNEVPEEDTVP